jgi:hypothetical protein
MIEEGAEKFRVEDGPLRGGWTKGDYPFADGEESK